MIDGSKIATGALMALGGVLAPIRTLAICMVVFIAIDFVTGVMASYKRAKRANLAWSFQSTKMWNTAFKLGFVMAGLVMASLIDTQVLQFMNLKLANIFTGFVCGTEFWSFLENAGEISQHSVFRGLKKIMKQKVDEAIEINKDKEDETNCKEDI